MKKFIIDEQQVKQLEQIKSRLFTENRMNGDEMRDAAQAIEYIIRIVRELEIPEGAGGTRTSGLYEPKVGDRVRVRKEFEHAGAAGLVREVFTSLLSPLGPITKVIVRLDGVQGTTLPFEASELEPTG